MRHEKAQSLLHLARVLAGSAEGLSLDEMAEVAGVGRRTVERMRDALEQLFPQMEVIEELPNKRYRMTSGLDGLFQAPTAEELVALGSTAEAMRAAGHHDRAAALASVETKIRSSMRSSALRKLVPDMEALLHAETVAVQAGPRPFEDETVLALVRHAVKAMCGLRFSYGGGTTPGRIREVAPYGLMFGRTNYLVAAELGSTEPKSWRLDRLHDLALLDCTAPAPQDFSLSAFAGRSFGVFHGDAEDVVLRIKPHGAVDALGWRFHSNQRVVEQPDGSVLVSFTASGMLELAWHLFTWADKVDILAPPRLQELMLSELKDALATHLANHPTEFVGNTL
jgi:predicted DNA-binding transcriptional regulator YafY